MATQGLAEGVVDPAQFLVSEAPKNNPEVARELFTEEALAPVIDVCAPSQVKEFPWFPEQ